MPNRNFYREMALLCAPLLAMGGVFGWSVWQKRGRTPRIEMTVRTTTLEDYKIIRQRVPLPFSPDFSTQFRWDAAMQGGPLSNYRFGWNQQIVALTTRGPIVVWQPKNLGGRWKNNAPQGYLNGAAVDMNFAAQHNRANLSTHFQDLEIDENALPLDTQALEWRGQMAAIPSDDADVWHAQLDAATLQNWAAKPGAASWKGVQKLPYDSDYAGPILIRSQKQENPNPDSLREVEIEILLRQINRRSFRRLVAFDGKKRRVLWTDADKWNEHLYWKSWGSTGSSGRDGETLSFDVGKVPAAWGEIVFLDDVVFDIANRGPLAKNARAEWLNQNALVAFEKKTSGFRVQRRLTLRSRQPMRR